MKPTVEPDLIDWFREQIDQDIRLMKALTNQSRPRTLAIWEWKNFFHARREAEERLPNRYLLRRLLDEHPHNRLGCETCVMTASRWCPTVMLTSAIYRSRKGWRPEWDKTVDLLMDEQEKGGARG
jgi:hypothetical protein